VLLARQTFLPSAGFPPVFNPNFGPNIVVRETATELQREDWGGDAQKLASINLRLR
jgi:hypothetical protein